MIGIIIFSIFNLLFCIILHVVLYNISQNYTDLGKQKVKFELNVISLKRSLVYTMTILYDNQYILQTISKEIYENLLDFEYTTVYIRKYNSKFHLHGAKYEFRLYETDWHTFDKKTMIKSFYFMFIILEFLIIVIGLQLEMPF